MSSTMRTHSLAATAVIALALSAAQNVVAVDDILGGAPLSDSAPNFAFLDHPKQPSDFWGNIQGKTKGYTAINDGRLF